MKLGTVSIEDKYKGIVTKIKNKICISDRFLLVPQNLRSTAAPILAVSDKRSDQISSTLRNSKDRSQVAVCNDSNSVIALFRKG